ncbi:hypothetical protein NQ318_012014 [Aromia moschata]|uniref:Uncharacterized protein n=1 Tax=Aromia moschata TaxID=1265417 RepID=A0AAV8YF01_9CUCU|nr:hypothetical protein NQ318_012014 [Aromia moschata]
MATNKVIRRMKLGVEVHPQPQFIILEYLEYSFNRNRSKCTIHLLLTMEFGYFFYTYEVCILSNETGNVAPDLATLRRRDMEGRFNFLIHRLLSLPISKERFEHENNVIKDIAKNNNYSVHLIDKLIKKHKFGRTLYNSTTVQFHENNNIIRMVAYN